MDERGTLLITWLYHEAIGHLVEAASASVEYKHANPHLSVCLLLNARARCELLDVFPWIDRYYAIDPGGDVQSQLEAEVPCEWDYVVHPRRLRYRPEEYYPPSLLRANQQVRAYVRARKWEQFQEDPVSRQGNLPYEPYAPFRMALPPRDIEWAMEMGLRGKPSIALLVGRTGSPAYYPSIHVWSRIVAALRDAYPGVRFMATGVSCGARYGLSYPKWRNHRLHAFARAVSEGNDYLDAGLSRQLALIAEADVFIAPHTGFAFLAPCVGTPWLALSGGPWGDAPFAGVPFYYDLPRCGKYPCYDRMRWTCRLKSRIHWPVTCLGRRLALESREIVHGVKHLLDADLDFDASFEAYRRQAIEKRVAVEDLWRIGEYFAVRAMNRQGSR